MPEGALQKLFDWPNKWISVVPRSLLPPTFLQNAYQELAKHLRSISVLSLGIVGVNCVSSHYRDTEVFSFLISFQLTSIFQPFRLSPARALWRRFKKGLVYQRLNTDEKIPPFTSSIKGLLFVLEFHSNTLFSFHHT